MRSSLIRGSIPLLLLLGRSAELASAADAAHRFRPPTSVEDAPSGAARKEPRLELSAWLGATRFAAVDPSSGGSRTGFRFGEMAFWPRRNVRLWYQVDNGLSIDSFDLGRAHLRVPAHYVGGFVHYQGRYTTRLELGLRDLPGGISQRIIRGEQVFFLPQARVVRIGGWWGAREDHRNEWILYAGPGLRVGERLRFDPTVFFSRSGVPGEQEWRGLLAGEYGFASGVRAAAGVASGQRRDAVGAHGIWEGYVKASVPLGALHRAHVLVRREWIDFGSTTVLAAGVTLGAGSRR
jgi:hypothetical protein